MYGYGHWQGIYWPMGIVLDIIFLVMVIGGILYLVRHESKCTLPSAKNKLRRNAYESQRSSSKIYP